MIDPPNPQMQTISFVNAVINSDRSSLRHDAPGGNFFLISTQVNTNSTQNPTPIQLNTTSATILAPNHYSRNKQINKQKQLNWNIELDSSESGTCDTFFMDTVQACCQCCAGQFSNCYFASSLLHTVHSLAWLLICKNVPRTPRARLAGGCTASVCTSAMQCAVCTSVCTCVM